MKQGKKYQDSAKLIDNLKLYDPEEAVALALKEVLIAMEQEQPDLERYLNLFGFNPKFGVSGAKISSVTYKPQPYNDKTKLYLK